MIKAVSILQKVVVNYFYKVNAGFFVFAFFVLFGLPYSVLAFHYSLITGIIQSPVFLLLVMLAWLLYNLKCINYVIKQLQHPQQSFLFSLNCLSFKRIYLYNLYVQTQVYLPVLLYAVAIIAIAFKKHQYLCGTKVIFFNLIILLATPLLYIQAIQQKKLAVNLHVGLFVHLKISKPYFLFPVYFLLNDRKQMLLVTKIFSLLMLYGFIKLYEPERYDIRPIQLCLLVIAAAHTAIVYEIKTFEDEYLSFGKNLPISLIGRYVRMIATYTCLLLPEFTLLLKGLHLQFSLIDYPQLLLLLVALLCMFHVVLLLDNINMDQLIRIVFGVIAASFFIILYNPGIFFAAAMLGLSFVLYHTYYFNHERQYT